MNKRRVIWTPEEDRLLGQVWPHLGLRCASQFPRHSAGAVKVRSYKLGLRYVARPIKSIWADDIRISRSCGSGIVAPSTYRQMLCRERLEALGK